MTKYFDRPPVVVGGVGGSGTRVVAAILREAGIFIGAERNDANDNMLMARNLPLIRDAAMAVGPRPAASGDDFPFDFGADVDAMVAAMLEDFEREMHAAYLAQDALRAGWGWKNPNNLHILASLPRRFGAFHYVQVVRHGLDMAFSSNQNQLRLWGWRYLIDQEKLGPAEASFRFWVRANRQGVRDAKRLGLKLTVLNFDQLCADPKGVIDALARDIGFQAPPSPAMYALVEGPESIGRFRQNDVSFVTEDDRAALREFGFEEP
jgi:hypothetical protein